MNFLQGQREVFETILRKQHSNAWNRVLDSESFTYSMLHNLKLEISGIKQTSQSLWQLSIWIGNVAQEYHYDWSKNADLAIVPPFFLRLASRGKVSNEILFCQWLCSNYSILSRRTCSYNHTMTSFASNSRAIYMQNLCLLGWITWWRQQTSIKFLHSWCLHIVCHAKYGIAPSFTSYCFTTNAIWWTRLGNECHLEPLHNTLTTF